MGPCTWFLRLAMCLLFIARESLPPFFLMISHWIFFIIFFINNFVQVWILVWFLWRLTLTVILLDIVLFNIFYHFFLHFFPQTISHMVLHLWCSLTNSPAACIPRDRSFWCTLSHIIEFLESLCFDFIPCPDLWLDTCASVRGYGNAALLDEAFLDPSNCTQNLISVQG